MYYAEVIWWDAASETDRTEYVLICAMTWSEAVMYIDQQVDNIESIKINLFTKSTKILIKRWLLCDIINTKINGRFFRYEFYSEEGWR